MNKDKLIYKPGQIIHCENTIVKIDVYWFIYGYDNNGYKLYNIKDGSKQSGRLNNPIWTYTVISDRG